MRAIIQGAVRASSDEPSEKVRLQALRKYGNFALAYSATFQPGLDYFGGEEGFLAYKQVGSTAFVLSNPLAPIGRCEDLIRSFVSERRDVCFWQASRRVAKILEKIGFCVNEMGTETRLKLDGYGFDGPRKRNFRRALNRAACCGYTIAECSVTSLDRKELKTVSERWRQTRGVKNREMTFLTRPAILDDEVDVRKFCACLKINVDTCGEKSFKAAAPGTGRPPETISAIGSSSRSEPGLMPRRAVLFND
jgi:lysylphosphatidylglycerol synthetase-like protein (DUF2156 family)